MSEQEHTLFERCMVSNYPSTDLTREGDGYRDLDAHQHWTTWQAARQAPASGEVEPVAYLVECDGLRWAHAEHKDAEVQAMRLGADVTELFAHPPAKVPEAWRVEPQNDYGVKGLIIGSPRIDGVRDNTYISEDSDNPAERLLYLMLTTPTPDTTPEAEPFQSRVQPWLLECFGARIAGDKEERNHRFLEEALELVQSLRCTAEEAHKLVDYVFSRPVGDPPQEVGGVQVTLAALCLANAMDMHKCGEAELARIAQPEMVEKIREKQKRKPSMSPLPGVYPDRPPHHRSSEHE